MTTGQTANERFAESAEYLIREREATPSGVDEFCEFEDGHTLRVIEGIATFTIGEAELVAKSLGVTLSDMVAEDGMAICSLTGRVLI